MCSEASEQWYYQEESDGGEIIERGPKTEAEVFFLLEQEAITWNTYVWTERLKKRERLSVVGQSLSESFKNKCAKVYERPSETPRHCRCGRAFPKIEKNGWCACGRLYFGKRKENVPRLIEDVSKTPLIPEPGRQSWEHELLGKRPSQRVSTSCTATGTRVPPLLTNPDKFASLMGPHEDANWVVGGASSAPELGRLLIGRYPGCWADTNTEVADETQILLDAGVDVFVSFTHVMQGYWMDGITLDYREYIRTVLASGGAGTSPSSAKEAGRKKRKLDKRRLPVTKRSKSTNDTDEKTPEQDVEFLHFRMEDWGERKDDDTLAIVTEIIRRVLLGQTVYAHCQSGRGRTGCIIAPVLMALYDLPADRAIELMNNYKSAGRTGHTQRGHMPESPTQRKQIYRLEKHYREICQSVQLYANEL